MVAIRHGGRWPGLAVLALALAACSPAGPVIGAGAAAGVAVADDRPLEQVARDAGIQAAINRLWLSERPGLLGELDIAVKEGRVLLTGSVDTPDDRVEAIRLAWRAENVVEVINEIAVSDAGGLRQAGRDRWISATLSSRLTLDTGVRAVNYTVDTAGGVVHLIGIAQSRAELDRVLAHARDVSGVKRVVSHVRIAAAS